MSATVNELLEPNMLYVGEGVTVRGAVLTAETLVVHGVLEGDISVGDLLVGETGTIKGRIDVAQKAEILGEVFERLNVKGLLILRSGCRVDGNVSFGTLQIEQGASIIGGISGAGQQGDQQQTVKPERKEVARAANGSSALPRVDLSALGLVPNPVSAAS
ncbi:MAG: polymer-forming cytoskeletal protein [Xanthobacteraceae bacterium]